MVSGQDAGLDRAARYGTEEAEASLGGLFLSRFYRATRAVNDMVGREVSAEFGLELRDFMVLSSICKGVRYPSAIARRLHANKFAISRIVQKLTEQGLIDRQIDPDDSRKVRLDATSAGLELRQHALVTMQARVAPLLEALGEEQAAALIAGLEAVIDYLGAEPGGAGSDA